MGVLLLVGFAVLVTAFVMRAGGPRAGSGGEVAAPAAPATGGAVFVLPDDARIHGLAATDAVVVVHWVDAAGADHLTALDPATGRIVRILGREGSE